MKNYWILLAGILLAGGSAEALEFRQARKQMGALKVLDLKKPVIELSGKSGAQNKKSYYVCGSLYLASPQDFRGKQLRVKAAALQGAEKLNYFYIRAYNQGSRKPVWSAFSLNSPFAGSSSREFTVYHGGAADMGWEGAVVSGEQPDKVDRIEFWGATQADHQAVQLRIQDIVLEKVPAESGVLIRQARKQQGDLKVVDLKKPVIELSGKSGVQNGKSYYISCSLLLPAPQDWRGKQLRLKAEMLQGVKQLIYFYIRVYNQGSRKPVWSAFAHSFPFSQRASREFTVYNGGAKGLIWESSVASGNPPDKVERIEILAATQEDLQEIRLRLQDFILEKEPPEVVQEIRARAAVRHWTPVPVYSDKPADTRNIGSIRPADIARAKENIRRHEWAQNCYKRIKDAGDFWMKLTPEQLKLMIPEEDAWFKCLCPNCGTAPEFAWSGKGGLLPDLKSIRCSKCSMVFPNEKYPENHTYTVKNRDGSLRTIRCYKGKDQISSGENYGPHYHITGAVNYTKIRKIGSVFSLAFAYAIEGKMEYAQRVREVLLRLAQVYPNYIVKFRATPYPTPRQSRQGMGGKLCAWKFSDSHNFVRIFNAYALTRDSGIYSDADKVAIENGLCREFKWLMTAFPPQDSCSNAIPYHMTASALCASILGDHELMDWVLQGANGYISFINKWYHRDGFWHENSASYANMANEGMIQLVAAIQGYSDPESYKGDDRYDKIDLLKLIPSQGQVLVCMGPAVLPTGAVAAFNDSSANSGAAISQMTFQSVIDPTPENRARAAYFIHNSPRQRPSDVCLMYRDPDMKPVSDMPDIVAKSQLLPGPGWAMLRHPASARESAAALTYGRFSTGHSHDAMLNYLYCDFKQEVSCDLGYLSWWHPLRPWLVSPLSHNVVVVDGEVQSRSSIGYAELFTDGKVAAVRAAAPDCYPGKTERYERTLLNVSRPGGRQYLVDFFYVKGGEKHLLAFHADGPDFFAPSGTAFQKAELPEYLAEKTGKKYLKDTETASVPAGVYPAAWQFDPQIRTTLHLALDRPAKLYHGVGSGLRDTRNPYLQVPLHVLMAENDGKESLFASVLNAVQKPEQNVTVEQLPVKVSKGCGTALRITHGDGEDLVIHCTEPGMTVRLADYPGLQVNARTAMIRFRDGKAAYMWCEDGSVTADGKTLDAGRNVTGKVLSVDPVSRIVRVAWDHGNAPAIPAGRRLMFPDHVDGVYKVAKSVAADGISVITFTPDETVRLEKGAKVLLSAWAELL